MAKIVHYKPQPIKAQKLNPELQAIFNELPTYIDYCERMGQRLADQIISGIEDEINLTPERREQIITGHRDKFAERYKELITSGLRLKATDKEDIIQKIGLWMYSSGTWKIPFPKDTSFKSLEPDPENHIKSAIEGVFKFYAIIQAFNKILIPPEPATSTPDPKKQPKPFPEYILHPERERIAEALKTTFRDEKGKAIRLMIEVLINQPQPLITYGNRAGTSLFNAMKLYFDWYIGTKQSIFDYKRINDETDYKAIELRVLYILESIKNNK
jgi:hypothetical protein